MIAAAATISALNTCHNIRNICKNKRSACSTSSSNHSRCSNVSNDKSSTPWWEIVEKFHVSNVGVSINTNDDQDDDKSTLSLTDNQEYRMHEIAFRLERSLCSCVFFTVLSYETRCIVREFGRSILGIKIIDLLISRSPVFEWIFLNPEERKSKVNFVGIWTQYTNRRNAADFQSSNDFSRMLVVSNNNTRIR